MSFSQEAISLLGERGFVKATGGVDSEAVANAITEYLLKKPDGASVGEIATDIIGTSEDDAVRGFVSRLTSLDGRVQRLLNGDGWVLIHKPIRRNATDETGEKFPRIVRLRVVTRDPAAIEEHLVRAFEAKDARLRKRQLRILARYVVKRHPELRARVEQMRLAFVANADEAWKALPPQQDADSENGE